MKRSLTTLTLLLAGVAASSAQAQGSLAMPAGPQGTDWTRSEVRRYWPEEKRPPAQHYERPIMGWFDLRGGFYDEQGVSANDWTVGIKAVGRVAPNVMAGMTTDLHGRSESGRSVTSSYVDATGHTVTTTTQLYDAESHLWPIMGVLEMHLPAGGFDPYVGGGAGWEFLNVQVHDANSGYYGDTNYDGFGYQFYGGLGMPIAARTRFTVEAYYNGSTVDREFIDYNTGFLVEENIEVDGGGLRGSLSFAF